MATTHGVHVARAVRLRALAAALAVVASFLALDGLVDAAGASPRYGWPVKPFHRQHPVRGFFGDPRIGMTPKGVHSGFHFGVDISCPNGTPVYATLDGVARRETSLPEVVTVIGRDGHTEFGYWHIRPAVANGQQVRAYRTLIGWAAAPWEHVHFAERRDGRYVNPLRPGALGPYLDTTRPWIKQLRMRSDANVVSPHAAHGTVELVVEAYDETPVAVPGRWGGKPVTPALLRWRLSTLDRRSPTPWRTAIDHRLVKPKDNAYTAEYARWTRQNKRNRPGRYRFVLAAAWDTRGLADGRYVVEVEASDVRGNRTVRRFPLELANRALLRRLTTVTAPFGHPPTLASDHERR